MKTLFKPATSEMIANRPPVPHDPTEWGHSPALEIVSMMRANEIVRKSFDDYMYKRFVLGKWGSDDKPETCTEEKMKMQGGWAARRLDEWGQGVY